MKGKLSTEKIKKLQRKATQKWAISPLKHFNVFRDSSENFPFIYQLHSFRSTPFLIQTNYSFHAAVTWDAHTQKSAELSQQKLSEFPQLSELWCESTFERSKQRRKFSWNENWKFFVLLNSIAQFAVCLCLIVNMGQSLCKKRKRPPLVTGNSMYSVVFVIHQRGLNVIKLTFNSMLAFTHPVSMDILLITLKASVNASHGSY